MVPHMGNQTQIKDFCKHLVSSHFMLNLEGLSKQSDSYIFLKLRFNLRFSSPLPACVFAL